MIKKVKNYKEQENEKTRGKLRYLKRVAADFESEEELQQWLLNQEPEESYEDCETFRRID